jgi:hypothetical protein
MKTTTKLWIGIIALIVLSPLGLILPAWLGAGTAWGEWSTEELKGLIGYVPAHFGHLSRIWHAPLPDYAFSGQEHASTSALSISYIVSAVVGVAAVVIVALLLGKLLARREKSDAA